IYESVAIVISERRAGRPSAVANAGFGRHVRKCTVAVVAVEDVASEAGEVDVGPAIVVVVPDRSAHCVAGARKSGGRSDVGECTVVVVVVESAGTYFLIDRHGYGRSIGEVDVRPAVAIIVQQQHAAAHGFHDVFLFRVGGVFEVDSGLRGDINKLWYRPASAFFRLGSRRRRRRYRMATLGRGGWKSHGR